MALVEYRTRETILQLSQLPVVVREQDGEAEKFLFDNMDRLNEILPTYWAMLTLKLGDDERVTAEKLATRLRGPDLDQIAVEIGRATSPDDSIKLTGKCPDCKKPVNWGINFGQLDFMPIPDGKTGPDPTFEFLAPRDLEIVWGYPTGKEEMEEWKTPGFDPTRQSWKAIRTINGQKPSLRDVLTLPSEIHKAVRIELRRKRCGYDTRVKFEHICGSRVVMNLLTDPSFQLPGLPEALDD